MVTSLLLKEDGGRCHRRRYASTGAFSCSLPSSTICMMAHAVGVFDREPTLNSVSVVNGIRADRSAKPNPFVQTTSPLGSVRPPRLAPSIRPECRAGSIQFS